MPRTWKAEAPIAFDEPEIEGRYVNVGGYTVAYDTHKADLDPAPCSAVCPTTVASARTGGVVKRGKIMFRYADHDEVFEAGDAYYGAPGHLPLLCAGTEPIEFSPTDALKRTMDVLGTNLEAAKASTVSATQ